MPRHRKGSGEYAEEPWFKLTRRLFRSSVWEEDLATRIVWITLLHLAQLPENRKHGHGTVLITRVNLGREAYVSAEQLEHALARLTAPDTHSRTEPGKGRIDILPNGFRVRSFDHYHDANVFEAWRAQRVAAGKARAAKAGRCRGRFTSEEPATAGHSTRDRWPGTSNTEKRRDETSRFGEDEGEGGREDIQNSRVGTGPSLPAQSRDGREQEDRPPMTAETAAQIETAARKLEHLVKGETPAGEWIRRKSRIEASNGQRAQSFEDPRRSGISENWGQATLSLLREELAYVEARLGTVS